MNPTPGPWQYVFEGGTVAFIVQADGTTVCKLSTTENSTAHSALPSNVRLIAAAPELLRLLREAQKLGLDLHIGSAYISRAYIDAQTKLNAEIDRVVREITGGQA